MKRKWYFIAPLAILALVGFVILGGEIVMQLWNWLLPGLFGWRQITFWQGLGILLLCRILFGGLGWRGSGRSNLRRRMEEKMAGRYPPMTSEEWEKFRQLIRERWGFGPPAGETKGQ